MKVKYIKQIWKIKSVVQAYCVIRLRKVLSLWNYVKPNKVTVYNIFLLAITLFVGNWLLPKFLNNQSEKIASENERAESRGEFVKVLAKNGNGRIYYAERHIKNIQNEENVDVLNKSWSEYMESIGLWNEHNLSSTVFIEHYYDQQARRYFDEIVQKNVVVLHENILRLRDGEDIDDISASLEGAKNCMFKYVEYLLREEEDFECDDYNTSISG